MKPARACDLLADIGWTPREFARRLEWDQREVRRWFVGDVPFHPCAALWLTEVAAFFRAHPAPKIAGRTHFPS